ASCSKVPEVVTVSVPARTGIIATTNILLYVAALGVRHERQHVLRGVGRGSSTGRSPEDPRCTCHVERNGPVSGLWFSGAVLAAGKRRRDLLAEPTTADASSGRQSPRTDQRPAHCRATGPDEGL